MLSDLSSRIKRAKERLALTQEKEERFREQMAQQAAEAGTGLNKVIFQLQLMFHIIIFEVNISKYRRFNGTKYSCPIMKYYPNYCIS